MIFVERNVAKHSQNRYSNRRSVNLILSTGRSNHCFPLRFLRFEIQMGRQCHRSFVVNKLESMDWIRHQSPPGNAAAEAQTGSLRSATDAPMNCRLPSRFRTEAYEQWVDRFLSSPPFWRALGPMVARLARFAETDGFEHDRVRKDPGIPRWGNRRL